MKRTLLVALLLLVPVISGAVKTTGSAPTDRGEAAPTEKWEYLAVAGPSTTNFLPTGNPNMRKEDSGFGREAFVLEQHLDRLGTKGWELVSVAGPPTDPAYYFKRRK